MRAGGRLSSVKVAPRGIPHPAMCRGEQYFSRVQDLRIKTDHVTVLKIITDGYCVDDSLIIGQRIANYHKSVLKPEMDILERSMIANHVQDGERTTRVERI